MAQSASISGHFAAAGIRERSPAIPWYVWNFTLAVVSVTVGGNWDVSWHLSIGRDSFWTPAHLLIYLCGILGGLGSAALILGTTFGKMPQLRASSISMWGFRGPLGAFVAAWGGVAMLVSAPFDDWWHNAYGLDVKILSPPHVVLILGILAIKFGALLLILGEMNRADEQLRRRLQWFFLFVGALLARDLVGIFTLEYMQRTMQHSARFFLMLAITLPLGHFAIARASGMRWGLTGIAAISLAISLTFLWILPLFPAEPKLGPVYQNITHFIPPGGFPLLVIVGLFAVDWITPRVSTAARDSKPATGFNYWAYAALAFTVFFAVFAAVQWPFSDFLQSPGARNWFFGAHYLNFFTHPDSDMAQFRYTAVETSLSQFWWRMGFALVAGIVSTRLGLALGSWMQKIQR